MKPIELKKHGHSCLSNMNKVSENAGYCRKCGQLFRSYIADSGEVRWMPVGIDRIVARDDNENE